MNSSIGDLITRYMDDGFEYLDIELKNGICYGVNAINISVEESDKYVFLDLKTHNISIPFSGIKSVAI